MQCYKECAPYSLVVWRRIIPTYDFKISIPEINSLYNLGDEILAVNGLALQGMSHSEAISVFKNIRVGKVVLHLARRDAATRRYVYDRQNL